MVDRQRNSAWLAIGLLCAALPLVGGCGQSGPPRFQANLVQMAANGVSAKHQQQIATILQAMFGTPDEPYVLPESGLDLAKIQLAAGPVKGYQHGLYRLHCVHCHGITGDGMGPTASFLKPYPRDYRQGLYKFKSTASNAPPIQQDLVHTLKEGVAGTAMPSFKLLPQAEIEALVEYVRYLSLRGQTELSLIDQYKIADAFDPDKEDFPTTSEFLITTVLSPIAAKWQGAPGQVPQIPTPPADFGSPESIARGKAVFYDKGGCVKCHGPTALGDGQLVLDLWNDAIFKLETGMHDREQSLRRQLAEANKENDAVRVKTLEANLEQFDQERRPLVDALRVAALPPRASNPRNLRQGIYRGGRQPFEVFYRLKNGIFASAMPNVPAELQPDDIWHLVDFVLDLPYQPGSQPPPEASTSTPPRDRL